jgi:hypothetical protein
MQSALQRPGIYLVRWRTKIVEDCPYSQFGGRPPDLPHGSILGEPASTRRRSTSTHGPLFTRMGLDRFRASPAPPRYASLSAAPFHCAPDRRAFAEHACPQVAYQAPGGGTPASRFECNDGMLLHDYRFATVAASGSVGTKRQQAAASRARDRQHQGSQSLGQREESSNGAPYRDTILRLL